MVKITIYITDRSHREPVYRVVGNWLKGVFPVSTGIIVQGLARPEYLMEIDIIAEIPADRIRGGLSNRHARSGAAMTEYETAGYPRQAATGEALRNARAMEGHRNDLRHPTAHNSLALGTDKQRETT